MWSGVRLDAEGVAQYGFDPDKVSMVELENHPYENYPYNMRVLGVRLDSSFDIGFSDLMIYQRDGVGGGFNYWICEGITPTYDTCVDVLANPDSSEGKRNTASYMIDEEVEDILRGGVSYLVGSADDEVRGMAAAELFDEWLCDRYSTSSPWHNDEGVNFFSEAANKYLETIAMAQKIAEKVSEAGGQTFFVGGCVRDKLIGRELKDIDIEVHGIEASTLEGILDELGTREMKGASFGVMGLKHYDLDIAMPRSETVTGFGHKDFEVSVDPFMSNRDAARRRDFTINAFMQDVLTGQVYDYFGGRDDLKRGIIRHVDADTFSDDPLRVFRAAQFAARFGFSVDDRTRALASTTDVGDLSRERVMGELEKALLKSDKPSVFFEELDKMDQLSIWFPELEALKGVPQDAIHHPEGDVWTHTMLVLDEAAKLRSQASDPKGFMLAALFHDLGKITKTEEINGRIHAYGHEKDGAQFATQALSRISNDKHLESYVRNMVLLHMRPNIFVHDNAKTNSFMKLFDESKSPEDLILLAKADALGCGDAQGRAPRPASDYEHTEEVLREKLAEYHRRMSLPCISGKDLIDAGYKPGPIIGKGMKYAHNLRLAGKDKDHQLSEALGYLRLITGGKKMRNSDSVGVHQENKGDDNTQDLLFPLGNGSKQEKHNMKSDASHDGLE